MKTGRLEAFSDGVLAIIITIMVLEMKVPIGADLEALKPIIPVFCSYLGSFIYLGIYWNNHHHLMQATTKVSGAILWANLNLLFWLSLLPFATGWMGKNDFAEYPVAVYGIVLLMASISYKILSYFVVKNEGKDSIVGKALSIRNKEYISISTYTIGVAWALVQPIVSLLIYVAIAIYWIIPDRRIERNIQK